MYIVLYNPLSNGGRGIKKLNRLFKYLKKKKFIYQSHDLTKIVDIKSFIDSVEKDDKIIIVGGDGTLHFIANVLKDYQVNNQIYLYQAGTGNDFGRNHKKEKKHHLLLISDKLNNLPTIHFNDQSRLFLNGCGLGLDGLVCYKVNSSTKKKNKFNYYKSAIKAFTSFKQASIEVIVDGKNYYYNKVWMATVLNGKYQGGGMKLAPHQDKNSEYVEIVVINKIRLFMLFLIMPTIYLGWHRFFKSFVHIIKGKEIKINFPTEQILQIDGEVYEKVQNITITK